MSRESLSNSSRAEKVLKTQDRRIPCFPVLFERLVKLPFRYGYTQDRIALMRDSKRFSTIRVTSEQSGALWHILGGVYFPVEINYYYAWLISKRLPVAKIKRDEDLELLFEWFSRLFFVYQCSSHF